jgi:hypothetical protein
MAFVQSQSICTVFSSGKNESMPEPASADCSSCASGSFEHTRMVTMVLTYHHFSKYAKMSGATMEASDSMMNFGVSAPSLPQVIFSFGTAPE